MGRPMLANHELSMHWGKKARLHEEWKAAGQQAAMIHKLPKGMPPCRVTVQGRYKRGTLPDPAGLAPSGKCLIDGLVAYGCWPDDTSEWVLEERYIPSIKDRDKPDAVILVLKAAA